MRRCFVILPLLVLMGAGRGPAAGPTEREGISIQLPGNWKVDPPEDPATVDKGHHTVLVARAPNRDKDDTGDYQTVLTIAIAPGDKVDAPAQQARLAADKKFGNYQSVEAPKNTKLAGVDAVTFGGTFTLGPLKLRAQQYLLTKDDHIYVITLTALESTFSQYQGELAESLKTLTLPAK